MVGIILISLFYNKKPSSKTLGRGVAFRKLFGGESMLMKEKCHIHQRDHYRHFNQRSDYRRESRAAVDTEYCDCHGNRQLEVVAGGGKGQRGSFFITCADGFAHQKTH